MPISETKRKQIEELKAKARVLYVELGTYKLVGEVLKRSHTWVMRAVRSSVDNIDLLKKL